MAKKFYAAVTLCSLRSAIVFQWRQTAQLGNLFHDETGEGQRFALPFRKQRFPDFHLHGASKFLFRELDSHGDKGNRLLLSPPFFFLKGQKALDKAVLAPAHAVGIISSFRVEDDKIAFSQQMFHIAKGIETLHRFQPIDRHAAQGGDKMPDEWVDKQLLFGDVTCGSPQREADDRNIAPELMLGKDDRRAFLGEIFPPFDLQPIDDPKDKIADAADYEMKEIASP